MFNNPACTYSEASCWALALFGGAENHMDEDARLCTACQLCALETSAVSIVYGNQYHLPRFSVAAETHVKFFELEL